MMNHSSAIDQKQIIFALLRYLIHHPDAKDSIDGILTYWLPKSYLSTKKSELQAILDELIARGWMTTRQHPVSPKLYALNRNRVDEIQDALKGL